jgi:hypothetical protein
MDQHRINNHLGIIRNQCEGFLLDNKEGLLNKKSPEEQHALALGIMKKVIHEVDEITAGLAHDHHQKPLPLL